MKREKTQKWKTQGSCTYKFGETKWEDYGRIEGEGNTILESLLGKIAMNMNEQILTKGQPIEIMKGDEMKWWNV